MASAVSERGPKIWLLSISSEKLLGVHPKFVEKAQSLFADFKVNVVTGFCFLGGFIGDFQETETWINEKNQNLGEGY